MACQLRNPSLGPHLPAYAHKIERWVSPLPVPTTQAHRYRVNNPDLHHLQINLRKYLTQTKANLKSLQLMRFRESQMDISGIHEVTVLVDLGEKDYDKQ